MELAAKNQNVFVHGRVTNQKVLQLLPNFHAHIQFSAFESFGIATLEARKAGIWAISRASLVVATTRIKCINGRK